MGFCPHRSHSTLGLAARGSPWWHRLGKLPSEMGAPRDGKAPTNLSPPPRGKGTCLGCEGGNWLPSTHPLSQPPAKPCMAGGELQQGL